MDAPGEAVLDIASTRGNAQILIGNVILHPGVGIDLQFDGLDGRTQPGIVLPGISVIGIVLGVVDVFFGAVDAQAFLGDFEFSGGVAKTQKGQDPDEDADGG